MTPSDSDRAPTPMRIRWVTLPAWALAGGLIVGAIGAIPTHAAGGPDALRAELICGALSLVAVSLGGAVVAWAARRGPAPAAVTFLLSGLAAGLAVLGTAAVLVILLHLPVVATMLWAALMYFAMLVSESVWLAKALRRDAFQVSLGNIRRKQGF